MWLRTAAGESHLHNSGCVHQQHKAGPYRPSKCRSASGTPDHICCSPQVYPFQPACRFFCTHTSMHSGSSMQTCWALDPTFILMLASMQLLVVPLIYHTSHTPALHQSIPHVISHSQSNQSFTCHTLLHYFTPQVMSPPRSCSMAGWPCGWAREWHGWAAMTWSAGSWGWMEAPAARAWL
jgi:hypothetical protein